MGVLAYGHSPVHTDKLYVSKAKELTERAGVDAIMLNDAPGLLTPDRVVERYDRITQGGGYFA